MNKKHVIFYMGKLDMSYYLCYIQFILPQTTFIVEYVH